MQRGIGSARLNNRAESLLQSRLDVELAALVEAANRGDPVWRRQSAWLWGLPIWSNSGRPFRGLSALLLWEAATDWKVPGSWQEATDPNDPDAVVVPLRSKRGWMPVAVVPGPRLAPLAFAVPKWDDERVSVALAKLHLDEHPVFASHVSKIRELANFFVQAMRRHQGAVYPPQVGWTAWTLSVAARVAAMVAESAYAAQVGVTFPEEIVWQRADVAAIFPWEAQEPGGASESMDRALKRKGARVLMSGQRPGQLPRRHDLALRLDRVWERGEILVGYSRIIKLMASLGLELTGEAALDARRLGLALVRKAVQVERLPEESVDDATKKSWYQLRARIVRKSWFHRLHALRFVDLIGDNRWHADRVIPRVRKVLLQSSKEESLSAVSLSDVGLVRLLDAMGPRRPMSPPTTGGVLAKIGTVTERSYRRYAICKRDGTVRWLDVPNSSLAEAQRCLVNILRASAPFAGVATAFEPGRNPALQARIHEGAAAAIVIDIRDFFGSIRPRHLRWAFHKSRTEGKSTKEEPVLVGGTEKDREDIIMLLFASDGRSHWLPQGAPSSPWAANLAAHPMDRRLRAWARNWGNARYSRYADDLVLSIHGNPNDAEIESFLTEAERAMRASIEARGWTVKEDKTRRWRLVDRSPLTLCGVEVPKEPGEACRLPRIQHRRARAALHELRCGAAQWDHGLLGWAWSATGHPGWLAWGNPELCRFAIDLAGPLLAEALMSGWADSIDQEKTLG